MKIINLSSIANPISISVQNPSQSDYDRFIGLEHYDSGEPVITRFQGTELLTTSAKAFKANDILIARRNVYLKRAGIVFFDGITSGDSIILRLKEDTQKTIGYSREDLIRYIPFMLNSEHFWIYANKHADGMNSKRISKDTLLEYEFELPSIDEMRDISDKLWAAYRLKEAYKKLLVATDKMVKSQFIEMFGDCANSIKLSSLCSTFADGDWIESKDQSELGIRLIQTGNVGNGFFKDKEEKSRYISEETFDNLHCTEIYPGDILVSRLPDPIGRACIIPQGLGRTITAVDCTIIRLKDIILPDYFIAYTMTPSYVAQINEVTTGTTRRRVSRANLGNILIPCPSIAKQQQFVAIAKQADKSKFELRKSIEAIDQVIKSLING